MLKRDMIRLVGTILLGGVVMLVTLPACGKANAGSTTALATPQATATSQPKATANATAPQPSATATASVAPAPATPTVVVAYLQYLGEQP